MPDGGLGPRPGEEVFIVDQRRNLEVRAADDGRTVEMSFASEDPYLRWFGYEILGMEPGECDLARINSGFAPFLKDHRNSVDSQIGRVLRAWLDGDKARALVEIFDTEEGDEKLRQIRKGDLGAISVGYRVLEMALVKEVEDGPNEYRVTRWEPHEISLVAAAADPTVGVGRSAENSSRVLIHNRTEAGHMPEAKKPEQSGDNGVAAELAAAQARIAKLEADAAARDQREGEAAEEAKRAGEAKRLAEIEAIAAQVNAPQHLREIAKKRGLSGEEFKGLLYHHDPEGMAEAMGRAASINLSAEQSADFSMVKFLRALGGREKSAVEAARAELEASAEAVRVSGRELESEHSGLIPWNVIAGGRGSLHASRAALITGTANLGGNTVETAVAMDLIDILRNRSFVLRNATPLTGLQGNFDMPRLDTEGAAGWIAENADLAEIALTFGVIQFRPHDVGGYTQVGRRLLMQSSLDVEYEVRRILMEKIAVDTDKAALYGGASNQIDGISEISGIGGETFAAAVPTRAELLAMEADVGTANADVGALAWAFNSAMKASLKGAAVDSGSGKFLYDDDGEVVGHRTEISNNITAGDVFFGNWSDSIAAMWGQIEVEVDPYSFMRKRQIEISAIATMDFNVRHVGSFSFGNDG